MIPIAIDPRIRARRVAVRRAEGRRRLRFVLGALGFVGLAVGAWALTRSPLLDLDHVRVEGVSGARQAAAREVIDLEPDTPMIELDLGAVEASLEDLAWVADAHAGRDWPGTLRVTVDPRIAVAIVGLDPAGALLVDADGVLIGPSSGEDLPRIAVESTTEPGQIEGGVLPALPVVQGIPEDLLPWIDAVTVEPEPGADGRPRVGLELIGTASVELGEVDHIDDKLAALRALLESVELECVALIDIAAADLTTVSRDPLCVGEGADPAPVAAE